MWSRKVIKFPQWSFQLLQIRRLLSIKAVGQAEDRSTRDLTKEDARTTTMAEKLKGFSVK